MKINYYSSLFFIKVLFGICFVPFIVSGQEVKDSIHHYYNAIYSPNDEREIRSAIFFFQNEIEILGNENDVITISAYKEHIANAQLLLGLQFESENSAIEALNLLDNIPEDSVIRKSKKRISNHLGRLYRKINDYDNAVRYFYNALSVNESSRDSIILINNLRTK